MKSIVIEKPNTLTIETRALPQPAPGEVRIKVKLAGICGSDSHIYRGHNPFAKYPRVIGHEFFGVIDAVGDNVNHDRIGERVSVDPVISCGHCYPCSVGKPNVCTSLVVLGVHRDGGFSEYAVAPARNAHRIPDNIADHHAVMVEPFTIAANVTGQVNPTEQDVALIYGAGPMGLTTVQALKGVYQVKTVIVVDRIEERLAMAKQSGADWTLNNGQHSLAEFLQQKALKPTLIVDAACHPAILQEAITLASSAARIVLMGFSSDPCEIVQQGITGNMAALIVIHNFAVLGLFALENITMAEIFGSRNRFTRMAISKEAGGLVAVGFGPVLAGIFCNMTDSWLPILIMLVLYSCIGLISALLMPEVRDRDLSLPEDAAEATAAEKLRHSAAQTS